MLKLWPNTTTHPFPDLPPTPASHFQLYFYAAVLQVIEQVLLAYGTPDAALAQFPFLAGYLNELAARGLDGLALDEATGWWRTALTTWEAGVDGHLPLRELRRAAKLDHEALTWLVVAGLPEEDVRFGTVFETMQSSPAQHRPTLGLLTAWWRARGDVDLRSQVRHLQGLGLVQVINQEAPRLEWALQIPPVVWDALRGEVEEQIASWAHYRSPQQLIPVRDLILPEALGRSLEVLPQLLGEGKVQALLVRGPQHNGRRTLLGSLARSLGCGLLEINGLNQPNDERWRLTGVLATLLHALPVVVFDLAPGETASVPELDGYCGALGVVLGTQGGVSGPRVSQALTLMVELPGVAERRRLWQQGFRQHPVADLDAIAERFRLSSGNIQRAAGLAQAQMALAGRSAVTLADVQEASRTLNRQALDTLAEPIRVSGDWGSLAVSQETLHELGDLEHRCRNRERLQTTVGPALAAQWNPGVRALFSGPSGTGKTLAARVLASMLQKDLYRLDLAAVVNKYIGETEKNLSRLFAHAEELDVILLLDEGDALLTQRTSVQTSNDRYANLETNYLLQRLETFAGILIVTTNAGERIDSAFQRRMDMVIDFRPPDVEERWAIWQLHLPARHAVPQSWLGEVASRCELSGGQIRNVALHAALLALDDGGVVNASHLEAAVRREYRKIGGVCPLRRMAAYSLR